MGQTDGRTPYRYTNPAAYYASSVNKYGGPLTVGPIFTRPACRAAAAAIDQYLLPAPDLSNKPAGCRCCCRSTGLTDGRTDRRTGIRPFVALSAYYADRAANCCSTNIERPHRCCHLPNKVKHIDRTLEINFLYSAMSREMSPHCYGSGENRFPT